MELREHHFHNLFFTNDLPSSEGIVRESPSTVIADDDPKDVEPEATWSLKPEPILEDRKELPEDEA